MKKIGHNVKIVWLESAVYDLRRIRNFIKKDNYLAASRASKEIKIVVEKLSHFPLIGKPVENLIDYRDIRVKFGLSGYVVRYRIYNEQIFIVHIKHCLELGFGDN